MLHFVLETTDSLKDAVLDYVRMVCDLIYGSLDFTVAYGWLTPIYTRIICSEEYVRDF